MKINKHITLDSELNIKLIEYPGSQIKVIEESLKAFFDGRILPEGCKAVTVDITDWIVTEINLSTEIKKKSNYQIEELDKNRYILSFELFNKIFHLYIEYYISTDVNNIYDAVAKDIDLNIIDNLDYDMEYDEEIIKAAILDKFTNLLNYI